MSKATKRVWPAFAIIKGDHLDTVWVHETRAEVVRYINRPAGERVAEVLVTLISKQKKAPKK